MDGDTKSMVWHLNRFDQPVGWLLVEDVLTVAILVVIPVLYYVVARRTGSVS